MYKYSKEKYKDALLTLGIIRVGTLHDFRREEHVRGVTDPEEGKKKVKHWIKGPRRIEAGHPDARDLERFGLVIKGGGSGIFSNVTFIKTFDSMDCFVLCTSSKLSKSVMGEFEGADACVQIVSPFLFYSVITRALNNVTPVVFRGVYKVNYQDRMEAWNGKDWGESPVLIKEKRHSKQYEIRAIWQPRYGQPIEPVIVGNQLLPRFCRECSV